MSVPVLVVLVAGLLVLVVASILCLCLKRQQLKRTADPEKDINESNKTDEQQNSTRYLVRVLDERRGSRNSLSGAVEEQPRASTPTRGGSEEGGRQNVLLQRQVSVRTSDFPHPANDTQSNVEVDNQQPTQQRSGQLASVDVHHEQEHVSTFRGAAPRARIRHNSAGSSSSRGSVRSAGGSIRRERRVLASPPTSPRDSPVESPRRRRIVAETSRTSTEQPMGLDVVLEWEPPQRAPSTDWTPLESSLDFWRHEHSRQPPLPDDDEHQRSKVRYNDTGSLEEVNVEEMVEYYIEDEEINSSDGDSLRLQYRQLWELRATLEDEEYDDKEEQTPAAPQQNSRSSLEQSPEADAGTSHTTSFESNTEPLLGEDTVRWPPHLLQLPSYESRRQTYKNILASRLRRMQDARGGGGGGAPRQQENNSFDSVETVDTEGSSTDASRLEQVTTSFESTTDNTDSTGDSQAHRLQQLRADSGYRSFETPGRAPKLHKRVAVLDSGELEELVTPSEVEDEGIGNASPPPAVHSSRSASKKRREFGRERDSKCITEIETDSRSGNESHDDIVSSGAVATLVTTSTGGRTTKTVVLPRYLRHGGRYNSVYSLPQRDYSVDEKSDALFREFSRCDPMLEPVEQGRHRFHYRRLQQARSSLDLELVHHKRLHDEHLQPKSSSADIPVIRVAQEDS